MSQEITFIGGGNMATAMIAGLLKSQIAPEAIAVVDRNPQRCAFLRETYGIRSSNDVILASRDASTIVFAVKPQVLPSVALEVAEGCHLAPKLLVSIAAGIGLTSLEKIFGEVAIVRAMPNTPALLGLGATGYCMNKHVTDPQKQQIAAILGSFGIAIQVNSECDLDAVTAVSGSGPAYFLLLMEEMIKSGEQLGLDRETAVKLTVQTALGAAQMAAAEDAEPSKLRDQVTSPGGTTHAAIRTMQDSGFDEVISKALRKARDKAIELGA